VPRDEHEEKLLASERKAMIEKRDQASRLEVEMQQQKRAGAGPFEHRQYELESLRNELASLDAMFRRSESGLEEERRARRTAQEQASEESRLRKQAEDGLLDQIRAHRTLESILAEERKLKASIQDKLEESERLRRVMSAHLEEGNANVQRLKRMVEEEQEKRRGMQERMDAEVQAKISAQNGLLEEQQRANALESQMGEMEKRASDAGRSRDEARANQQHLRQLFQDMERQLQQIQSERDQLKSQVNSQRNEVASLADQDRRSAAILSEKMDAERKLFADSEATFRSSISALQSQLRAKDSELARAVERNQALLKSVNSHQRIHMQMKVVFSSLVDSSRSSLRTLKSFVLSDIDTVRRYSFECVQDVHLQSSRYVAVREQRAVAAEIAHRQMLETETLQLVQSQKDSMRQAQELLMQELNGKREKDVAETVRAANQRFQDLLTTKSQIEAQLRRDLQDFRDENARSQANLQREHEAALEQLQANHNVELDRLQRIANAKEKELEQIERQLSNSRAELASSVKSSVVEAIKVKHEAEIQRMLSDHRDALLRSSNERDVSARELQARLAELERSLRESDETLRQSRGELERKQHELRTSMAAYDDLRREFSVAQASLNEREDRLQQVLEGSSQLDDKVSYLTSHLQAAAAALRTANEEREQVESSIKRKTEEADRLTEKISVILSAILTLLESLPFPHDMKRGVLECFADPAPSRASLQQACEAVRKWAMELDSQRKTNAATASETLTALQEAQRKIGELEEALRALRANTERQLKDASSRHAIEMERTRSQSAHLAEIARLEAVNPLRSELTSLNAQVDELSRQYEAEVREKEILYERALDERRRQHDDEMQSMQRELRLKLDQANGNLQEHLSKAQRTQADLKERERLLQEQVEDLRSQIESLRKEAEARRKEAQKWEELALNTQGKVREESVRLEQLRRRLEEKERELADNERRKESYRSAVTTKEREIGELHSLLERSFSQVSLEGIKAADELENETKMLSRRISQTKSRNQGANASTRIDGDDMG